MSRLGNGERNSTEGEGPRGPSEWTRASPLPSRQTVVGDFHRPARLDAGRAEYRAGERARPGCSQRRPRRWHSWAGDCTISFIASKMFAARARRTTREARVLPGSPANSKNSTRIIGTLRTKSANNSKSSATLDYCCTSSAVVGVCRNRTGAANEPCHGLRAFNSALALG